MSVCPQQAANAVRAAVERPELVSLEIIDVQANADLAERYSAQFRAEFLNALNHVLFSNPNTSVTSTAFGTITSEKGYPRRIQLGVKFIY